MEPQTHISELACYGLNVHYAFPVAEGKPFKTSYNCAVPDMELIDHSCQNSGHPSIIQAFIPKLLISSSYLVNFKLAINTT